MAEKLAVKGGTAVIPKGLEKPWPHITKEDKKAVMAVLDSGVLWGESAPETKALQEEWASYVGTKYCLAVNSGTAALHMAVAAADIGPGDEVITSAFSFLASASCILHHNAIPVFVDINPKTFTIDPAQIEDKITDRTRAIIPVHIHGLPADMDEIKAIARKHNLIVIEDACQAHGAKYKGVKVGTLGEMAAFSLNSSKNLPGGEGGLFNTDNEVYYDKATMVRMFGEPSVKEGEPRPYNAYGMGWMYRTQEMASAFARSQLRRLDKTNQTIRQNAEFLTKELAQIKGVIPPYVPEDRTHVYHMYRIRFDPQACGMDIQSGEFRQKVQEALVAEGVHVYQWQTLPLPGQSLFQLKQGYGKGCPWKCQYSGKVEYKVEDYPETLKLLDDSLCIHSAIYPPNGFELMKYYVEAFYKVFNNLTELL